MIREPKVKKKDSVDYLRFRAEMSSMLYMAMPRSKEVLCIGSRATDTDYDLRYRHFPEERALTCKAAEAFGTTTSRYVSRAVHR